MTQYRKNTDHYKLYEQRQRQESPRKKRIIKKILNKLVRREAARIESETGISSTRAWTTIRLVMLMTEQQLSYRRLATHLDSSQAELRRCGLKYAPSKSTLHGMISMLWRMDKKFMDAVILGMSAEDHLGDLHGDSTGFSLRRYKS